MNGDIRRGLAARPDCGASLIETLVAFSLTVAVSAAALFLFVLHQRLARAQLDTASLLQAQQAAHLELRRALRAAGRGGLVHQLPGQTPRPEVALEVQKQVRSGHAVGSRTAAEGTDVLVIRGVINGPLYWVDEYGFDPASRRGWVVVYARTPYGSSQSLQMLREAGEAGDDALLLVSGDTPGVHAVVPIVDVAASGRGRQRRLRVEFHADASRGPLTADFLSMSSGGSWPVGHMSRVDRVGVLEEWRFYIRPPDPESLRGSQLAMARLYPGSAVAWRRRSANLTQVIADGISDLEVTVQDKGEDGERSVTVTSTARIGEPAAGALRVEQSAASVIRMRNLR